VPKNERIVPKNERIVPKNERIVPKNERIVPKNERIVPKNERIVPKNETSTISFCKNKYYPEYLLHQMAYQLPITDVKNLCLTEKECNKKICQNQKFWEKWKELNPNYLYTDHVEPSTFKIYDKRNGKWVTVAHDVVYVCGGLGSLFYLDKNHNAFEVYTHNVELNRISKIEYQGNDKFNHFKSVSNELFLYLTIDNSLYWRDLHFYFDLHKDGYLVNNVVSFDSWTPPSDNNYPLIYINTQKEIYLCEIAKSDSKWQFSYRKKIGDNGLRVKFLDEKTICCIFDNFDAYVMILDDKLNVTRKLFLGSNVLDCQIYRHYFRVLYNNGQLCPNVQLIPEKKSYKCIAPLIDNVDALFTFSADEQYGPKFLTYLSNGKIYKFDKKNGRYVELDLPDNGGIRFYKYQLGLQFLLSRSKPN
jgi:hypothetical protein